MNDKTKIILAFDGEVALTPDQSPPVGAGQDRFMKALSALLAKDAFKALRVRTVTVATPKTSESVGGRSATHYDLKTSDTEGRDIAERRFDIEQTATGFTLRIGGGAQAETIGELHDRDSAIAIGTAWQKGILDLTGPQASRKAA